MLRTGFLVFCLLVGSLIASTTVHASEFSAAVTIDCAGEIHSDGDADQSPGDADRGVPHHHGGCHGHGLFAPVSGPSHALTDGVSAPFYFPSSDAFQRWATGPALRPPIA